MLSNILKKKEFFFFLKEESFENALILKEGEEETLIFKQKVPGEGIYIILSDRWGRESEISFRETLYLMGSSLLVPYANGTKEVAEESGFSILQNEDIRKKMREAFPAYMEEVYQIEKRKGRIDYASDVESAFLQLFYGNFQNNIPENWEEMFSEEERGKRIAETWDLDSIPTKDIRAFFFKGDIFLLEEVSRMREDRHFEENMKEWQDELFLEEAFRKERPFLHIKDLKKLHRKIWEIQEIEKKLREGVKSFSLQMAYPKGGKKTLRSSGSILSYLRKALLLEEKDWRFFPYEYRSQLKEVMEETGMSEEELCSFEYLDKLTYRGKEIFKMDFSIFTEEFLRERKQEEK